MKPFLRCICASLAMLPLDAAADTGRLTEMLRMIPSEAIPAQAPRLDIAYGNGDAVRNIARGGNPAWPAHEWAHEFAATRAAPPAQAAALEAGGGAAMTLGYRDWVHALEVSAQPARMGIHFLFPNSEMRLRGALFSAGMSIETRGGAMVLWDGDEDHTPSPERIVSDNPFGGAEGLPSRFVVDGQWALWASGWPQIDAMLRGGGPTLADRTEVAQAVSNLSQAVSRYGRLVAVRMSLDLTGQGLSGWPDLLLSGVMLADVVDRRDEAALAGFIFQPGTDVEALAQSLRMAWRGSMLVRWTTEPEVTLTFGAQPGLILAIDGAWGEDEAAQNAAFDALERALENGTLAAMLAAP